MKSSGVRRGVQLATASRKPGSAPTLGRVPKMPGYGQRALRHRRSSRDAGRGPQQRRMHLIGWSVALGVLSLLALGGLFTLWLLSRMQGGTRTDAIDPAVADARARVVSKFKSPTEDEALALVRKALALRNPEHVEGLIRTGPMTAAEVVDYLAAMPTVDGKIKGYIWLSSIDRNRLSLEGVQVDFEGTGKPKRRLAILTPDEKGVWKLDFPAFVRWVKPSWKALLEERAESAVVRVYVKKDHYFNGPFSDESQWSAYQMISPDTDATMMGYCRLGSPQKRAMDLMWDRGETQVARATLEIRRVEVTPGAEATPDTEATPRRVLSQFEISRVLAEDWVMGEKPLDAGLR